MTPTWAVILVALGVIADRWWTRMERTAEPERVAEGLRRFGAPRSNCRVIAAPKASELFDQERQS